MSQWLRLHGNAFVDALRRLAARPVAAAFAVLVLGSAIALPVIAAIALRSAGTATSSLDAEPHMNIYLALDAGDADVKRIEQALRASPEAARVDFVSRTQALDELKASTHLAEILAALDRNPLPHAFTVRLRSTEPQRVAAMRTAWSALPKVEKVAADFEWAEKLGRWVRLGHRVVGVLAMILGGAVAFIVGHLIRLQVLTRREEIEVSQLIGATAADVRRPFLYHGLVQGLLAGAVAVGLASALAAWAGGELMAVTPAYATELKVVFLPVREVLAVIGAAAALGLLGAWLAVDREIRRFSRA